MNVSPRLALGTAQFGLDYGINNKSGKIVFSQALEIMRRAVDYGIGTIDTAYAYADSEKVIGDFLKSSGNKLKIVSKLPKCSSRQVRELIGSSLERLGSRSLYGYLIHSFQGYEADKKIWGKLEDLKNKAKIEKIGFSLYFPEELDYLLKEGLKIDIIQIPYNIFDQRFKSYFPMLKKEKIEIHARSVFLQGLVFKDPAELDEYFSSLRTNLKELNMLSKDSGFPIFSLCLNFSLENEFIDKVVIGVDNIRQLTEIMEAGSFGKDSNRIMTALLSFSINDEKIILPFNWQAKAIAG